MGEFNDSCKPPSEQLARLNAIKSRHSSVSPTRASSLYGSCLRLIQDDVPWLIQELEGCLAAGGAYSAMAKAELSDNAALAGRCARLEARLLELERRTGPAGGEAGEARPPYSAP